MRCTQNIFVIFRVPRNRNMKFDVFLLSYFSSVSLLKQYGEKLCFYCSVILKNFFANKRNCQILVCLSLMLLKNNIWWFKWSIFACPKAKVVLGVWCVSCYFCMFLLCNLSNCQNSLEKLHSRCLIWFLKYAVWVKLFLLDFIGWKKSYTNLDLFFS